MLLVTIACDTHTRIILLKEVLQYIFFSNRAIPVLEHMVEIIYDPWNKTVWNGRSVDICCTNDQIHACYYNCSSMSSNL